MTRTGIPTTYSGGRFRSRLEARWAAMFDLLDWAWTYEPFDGAGYVPDFLVTGDRALLVEVKPAADTTQLAHEWTKVRDGLTGHWDGDVLLLGATPLPHQRDGSAWGWDEPDRPCAGLLAEYHPGHGPDDPWGPQNPSWTLDDAQWITCRACDRRAVFHASHTYASRPCGHYSGDDYLGTFHTARIHELWARAGSAVQWRPT